MENHAFSVLAAPLQGYTPAFWRSAHAAYIGGIVEYGAPFLRLEHGVPDSRCLHDLDPSGTPPETVPQLLVSGAADMRILCEAVSSLGWRRIDLNFGCPFVKVTDRGYGSGILANPDAVRAVLAEMPRFPDIRFSVKLRPGLRSPAEWRAFLPALNSAPLTHVVLHPRLGSAGYSGMPDRALFAEFRRACAHPVYYNGDIRTAEDAADLRGEFPDLPGVMIGRGLLANPCLALAIRGEAHDVRALLTAMLHRISDTLCAGEQALPKLKTMWDYLLPDSDRHLRKKLAKSRTVAEYLEYTDRLLATL